MSQPTPYTPTTDFSQQEASNASGRSTVSTESLDAEFANIETTLDATLANLALLQRDDGRLADLSCEIHTISAEVLNLMGGFVLRGLWEAATAYAVNDLCSNGAYTYVCNTAHTSGGSFDAQYWDQFGFTSGADAAQAAASAQTSANAADASADAAAASALSASGSASSASSSASSASTNAGTATTQANAASASATAAAGSAASAAASAASISTPIPVASGGTGATTASGARSALSVPANDGTGASGTWGIAVSGNSGNGVPPGAVLPFAMNSAPTGWLACDGSAVSRTTYAALFSAIGTTYGSGNGSTTFNLPDMRGYFLRGSGTNGDGTASGTFGAKQAEAIAAHNHALTMVGAPGSGGTDGAYRSQTGAPYGSLSGYVGGTLGSETRPKNIAMLYCIKT